MTTTLYGIANCDTIKKAKKWLNDNDIDFVFHDFRKDGIAEAWLADTAATVGWETLLNKRGTTYRQLDEADKASLDEPKALGLMLAYPAMIKRPVLEHNGNVYVGFKADNYAAIFTHD
ncbi:ArsC family reductase [Alteromonas halophila]|uniref:Arsenate reductase n=1 Tax=Alteromonas halophila TaxID=516698 RepID=A0A918JF27_9ALTE|nr:ArsC family reductase [Alteromonas halophila]GGW76150.1 arsenate reductase [Alteromonas halophila]